MLPSFKTAITRRNFRFFISYTKFHGFDYALKSALYFLEGMDLLPSFSSPSKNYQQWIKKNEPSEVTLGFQKNEAKKFFYRPLISVIIPVYNTDRKMLMETIESVVSQTYDRWELCVVEGGSDKPHVKDTLEHYLSQDRRIKIKFLARNKGIVGNTNEALKMAQGDFVAFLDHDDLLAPFALYEIVRLVNRNPDLDFIYSDEDKISQSSRTRFDPWFKPAWGPSPDHFRSMNFFNHLAVIKKLFLEKIGKLREDFEGAQDYELYIRVIENTNRIGHISKVLYHWRFHRGSITSGPVKSYSYLSAHKALEDHLSRKNYKAEVRDLDLLGCYRVKYAIKNTPLVSIIIVAEGAEEILKICIESIFSKTKYKNFEVLIVKNKKKDGHCEFLEFPVRIIYFDDFRKLSVLRNRAINCAKGKILVFLSVYCEVINSDWLETMLEHVQRKETGIVGAKLYYHNDRVEHGGIIIGAGDVIDEAHKNFPRKHPGYMGRLKIVQNISAINGVCMMIRKEVLKKIGGFDENFHVACWDVDFCLKIKEKQHLIVWTPFAEFYYNEHLIDDIKYSSLIKRDKKYFTQKWRHVVVEGDPYYNPNLNHKCADFSIKL